MYCKFNTLKINCLVGYVLTFIELKSMRRNDLNPSTKKMRLSEENPFQPVSEMPVRWGHVSANIARTQWIFVTFQLPISLKVILLNINMGTLLHTSAYMVRCLRFSFRLLLHNITFVGVWGATEEYIENVLIINRKLVLLFTSIFDHLFLSFYSVRLKTNTAFLIE